MNINFMGQVRLLFAIFVITSSTACGGGGGGGDSEPSGEPEVKPIPMASWEVSKGICSFDSEAAAAVAKVRGDVCNFVLVGNKLDGKPAPKLSWPSSENVATAGLAAFLSQTLSVPDNAVVEGDEFESPNEEQ